MPVAAFPPGMGEREKWLLRVNCNVMEPQAAPSRPEVFSLPISGPLICPRPLLSDRLLPPTIIGSPCSSNLTCAFSIDIRFDVVLLCLSFRRHLAFCSLTHFHPAFSLPHQRPWISTLRYRAEVQIIHSPVDLSNFASGFLR